MKTIDFINKFESLADEEVGEKSLHNRCALWHCGAINYIQTKESNQLISIFSKILNKNSHWTIVSNVNDGLDNNFFQETPRQRILAVLYQAREKGIEP